MVIAYFAPKYLWYLCIALHVSVFVNSYQTIYLLLTMQKSAHSICQLFLVLESSTESILWVSHWFTFPMYFTKY